MSEKKYVSGMFIKEVPTQYGGLLNVSLSQNCIDELAMNLKKDYVNITIMQRREKDKYGNTHYAVYNEYSKPESDRPPILTETPKAVIKDSSHAEPGTNKDLPF